MKLIHLESGSEVRIGDIYETSKGELVQVSFFREPHKPSSSGKVSVRFVGTDKTAEFFVSVIGCEWIEREDRLHFKHPANVEERSRAVIGINDDLAAAFMTSRELSKSANGRSVVSMVTQIIDWHHDRDLADDINAAY